MYEVSARFLDSISGSHRAAVRVQVLPTAGMPQTGPNPQGGVELPVLDGDVKLTSTADVNGTCEFSISGDYWDVLQPYGAELFVERGIDYGDGTRELVPCGYFGIEEISQDKAPAGPVRVSGADRARRLQRNRVVYPIEFPAGTTHKVIFDRLVNGTTPAGSDLLNYSMFIGGLVPITFAAYDPTFAKISTSLTCEDDPHAFLAKLADAKGCVLRFDRHGELLVQLRNIPPGAAPVYTVAGGVRGNLIGASRKVTREGVYNYVVARGSDPANPTGYRLAHNDDADSPLRWYGPFGAVVRYYASPLIQTNDGADAAAETVLSRYTGLPTSLSLLSVPNPALDPLDAALVRMGATQATHLIDQVSIPLTGSQPVEIVTRTLNEVILSEDDASGGGGFPNPPDPGGGTGGGGTGGGGTGGGGTGTGDTAAERFGWGTPIDADEFDYTGAPNATKWSVYNGPGHDGNGRRVPAQVVVDGSKLVGTGAANGDSFGIASKLFRQYGRWEVRCRSYSTATSGGGGTASQTLGVGGVATPAGAILATGDKAGQALTLTSSNNGTASSPKVYDGQGKTIGRVTFDGCQYVVVQNYRVQSGNQYGVVFDEASNCTMQNCDISNVKVSGDGDLNCFTVWGGNNNKIAFNTAINYVSGSPGGSHTDWIQHWVSSSHPNPANNYQIIGNKATGPANPSRDNNVASIHQIIMVESAGRGGNSGGSGTATGWLVADNEFGDSWGQSIKTDNGNNFIFTRNKWVGSSDKVFQLGGSGHKVYSDNTFGSGYGSVGFAITSGAGPGTAPDSGGTPTTGGGSYHPVLIIWPQSGRWPEDGEYDFLEGSAPGMSAPEAYLHYPHDATAAVQQVHFTGPATDLAEFHNFAIEWTSSGIVLYCDGVEWGRASGGASSVRRDLQAMPSGGLTIQLDNFSGTNMTPAKFEVEWVRTYSLTPQGGGGSAGTRLQAAQLILDRIDSNLGVLEDWTWAGAPAVVGQYNDELIALYVQETGPYTYPGDIDSGQVSTWLRQYIAANGGGGTGGGTGGTTATTMPTILRLGKASGLTKVNLGVDYLPGQGPPGKQGTHVDHILSEIENNLVIPGYADIRTDVGAVRLTSYVGAATTPNSTHSRVEYRELATDGVAKASWSSTSGEHYVWVRGAIVRLAPGRPHMVIAQIHDASDDVAVIRIEGGTVWARFGDTEKPGTLATGVTMGSIHEWMIKTVRSGSNTIIQYFWDDLVTPKATKSYAGGSGCYFKAGNYHQSTTSDDSQGASFVLDMYDMEMWHTGYPAPAKRR